MDVASRGGSKRKRAGGGRSKRKRAGSPGPRRAKRERAGLNKTQLCRYHAEGACRFGEQCAFAHNLSELCQGKKGWDAPNADLSRLKQSARRGDLPLCTDLFWQYLTPFFAELPPILRDQYKDLIDNDPAAPDRLPNSDAASWRELAQALTGYPWAVTLFWLLVEYRVAKTPQTGAATKERKEGSEEDGASGEDEGAYSEDKEGAYSGTSERGLQRTSEKEGAYSEEDEETSSEECPGVPDEKVPYAPIYDWDHAAKGKGNSSLGVLVSLDSEHAKGDVELFCIQAGLLKNLTDKMKGTKDCDILCSRMEVVRALQTLHRNLHAKQFFCLNALLSVGERCIWPGQYYNLSAGLKIMERQFSYYTAHKIIWIFQDDDDLIGIAGLLLLFLMWATRSKDADSVGAKMNKLLDLPKDALLKPCKNGLHFIRIATYYGAQLHNNGA